MSKGNEWVMEKARAESGEWETPCFSAAFPLMPFLPASAHCTPMHHTPCASLWISPFPPPASHPSSCPVPRCRDAGFGYVQGTLLLPTLSCSRRPLPLLCITRVL